jgi:ribonuclease HI
VLEGLQYAWRLGFKKVELMIDSKIVVNTLIIRVVILDGVFASKFVGYSNGNER